MKSYLKSYKKILIGVIMLICSSFIINVSALNIVFDENFGYGLECDMNSKINNGVSGDGVNNSSTCSGNVESGEKFNFPASSSSMLNYNIGSLIGWTKTVENNRPICATYGIDNTTIINYTKEEQVSESTAYYACYEDIINGKRYAQDDASADNQEVLCGSFLHITSCYLSNGTSLCNYDKYGSEARNGVVYRNKISNEQSISYCHINSNASSCPNYDDEIPGDRFASSDSYVSGDNVNCGDKLHITTCNCNEEATCMFDSINGQSANGIVYRKNLKLEQGSASCSETEECTTSKKRDITSSTTVNVCNGKKYEELVQCKSGYSINKTKSRQVGTCTGSDDCEKYQVVCTRQNGNKPKIDAPAVNVESNGYGYININATPSEGAKIVEFYVSQEYKIPTDSSNWKKVNNGSLKIEGTPGTYYIWAKDSLGNISDTYRTAVVDNINTNTTIGSLELYDESGNVKTPDAVAYQTKGISSSDYVRLSNKLAEKSLLANAAFNPFTTEYKVTVDSPTMTVYATLTSTDSKYVDGYEPRTVNLTYGVNTLLIKIQDKTGKVRTYTIVVTRTDDRKADNTLSKLSVDKGKLEFNSNITDYKVIIPKSTTNISIDATIGSDLASFVAGYEPGNVEIKEDVTVKLIKIKSQTGSTRTYVVTFVKEGSDEIKDKSLMLHNLAIENVYVPFEKDILNYSFSVGYENENIDLYPILEDETSKYVISLKRLSDDNFNTVSSYGVPLDVGENYLEIKVINQSGKESIYRFTIIRKEFGLEVSNDMTLKDLTVLGHDIKFKPNKKDYTVKIKTEKTLVITAVPNSNRAEVFIRGNEELTGFSTVRVKVVAENGEFETYSIDIKKDVFNKTIEIGAIIIGGVIIIGTCCILVIKKKRKQHNEYVEE